MARDLIKANNLKSITQKEEAVRTAFQKWVLQDPKGMPNMRRATNGIRL